MFKVLSLLFVFVFAACQSDNYSDAINLEENSLKGDSEVFLSTELTGYNNLSNCVGPFKVKFLDSMQSANKQELILDVTSTSAAYLDTQCKDVAETINLSAQENYESSFYLRPAPNSLSVFVRPAGSKNKSRSNTVNIIANEGFLPSKIYPTTYLVEGKFVLGVEHSSVVDSMSWEVLWDHGSGGLLSQGVVSGEEANKTVHRFLLNETIINSLKGFPLQLIINVEVKKQTERGLVISQKSTKKIELVNNY